MKKRAFFITLLGLCIFSGCTVLSFYPLFTENELVKNDQLLGKWQSINGDTVIWEISFKDSIWMEKMNSPFDLGSKEIPNRFTYTLNLYLKGAPEEAKAEFHVHLVKLGDQTFLDFYPVNWAMQNTILAFHLMRVHTFSKVEFHENGMEIKWFDSEWLEGLFANNRVRIRHENNGANILLTAKPEELQKFILKYGNDKNAYSEDLTYNLSRYQDDFRKKCFAICLQGKPAHFVLDDVFFGICAFIQNWGHRSKN
eukprot:TRINITY_DN3558_c2_g1_i2.p1 TRINITY_DN3558_c2_g1~~TRINITY_DN3558_c2_g1_i2.p1  ORF type:complete len:282 (-),score=31.52 TRINITY_DN3558_c2_g1_i2:245-1006(-)